MQLIDLVSSVNRKTIILSVVFSDPYSETCAPSILITFINMVLCKKPNTPPEGCDNYMFPGQPFFESVFLLIALASVPVMLFAKPYLVLKERKNDNVMYSIYLLSN